MNDRPFLSEVHDFPERLNDVLNKLLDFSEVYENDCANSVMLKCEAKLGLKPNNTLTPTLVERLIRLEKVLQQRGVR